MLQLVVMVIVGAVCFYVLLLLPEQHLPQLQPAHACKVAVNLQAVQRSPAAVQQEQQQQMTEQLQLQIQ